MKDNKSLPKNDKVYSDLWFLIILCINVPLSSIPNQLLPFCSYISNFTQKYCEIEK